MKSAFTHKCIFFTFCLICIIFNFT